jgi:hypothetical protein
MHKPILMSERSLSQILFPSRSEHWRIPHREGQLEDIDPYGLFVCLLHIYTNKPVL